MTTHITTGGSVLLNLQDQVGTKFCIMDTIQRLLKKPELNDIEISEPLHCLHTRMSTTNPERYGFSLGMYGKQLKYSRPIIYTKTPVPDFAPSILIHAQNHLAPENRGTFHIPSLVRHYTCHGFCLTTSTRQIPAKEFDEKDEWNQGRQHKTPKHPFWYSPGVVQKLHWILQC